MMTINVTTEVANLRTAVLRQIAATTGMIAHQPDIDIKLNDERAFRALNNLMNAYREMVEEMSSDRVYAWRNLADEEKKLLARANHNLKIINTLYGPQVAI